MNVFLSSIVTALIFSTTKIQTIFGVNFAHDMTWSSTQTSTWLSQIPRLSWLVSSSFRT